MRRVACLAVLCLLIVLSGTDCNARDERAAIKELGRKAKNIDERRKVEDRRLKEIDVAIARAQKDVDAARQRYERLTVKVQENRIRIAHYETALIQSRMSLAAKWKALYKGAYLDLADLLSFRPEYAGYVEAIISRDLSEMEKYDKTRRDLIQARKGLEDAVREQDAAIQDLESTVQALNAKHMEKQRLLASLDRQKKDIEGQIRQLMKRLQERPAALPNRGMAHKLGNLPWPVKGTIVRGFGITTENGFAQVSNGVDIEAPEGSPVKSIYAGRVVFYDQIPSFGNTMIIDHGGGLYTVYAHLLKALKSNGEAVSAQETVALVGKSGDVMRPTLHFEIRYKDKAQDPVRWLSKK